MAQAVTTGDQKGLFGAPRSFAVHRAMDEQSPMLQKKYDFAGRNFAELSAPDQNQIAGKDGGRHASAENAQADFAELADHFLSQSAGQFHRSVPLIVRAHGERPVRRLSC